MNIGIDIDNTLTKVQDELNQAAFNYAIKLGKKVDNPSKRILKITEIHIKRIFNFHMKN